MNEDNSSFSTEKKKLKFTNWNRESFFKILSIFQGKSEDLSKLVDTIRDSEKNNIIDHDTRDMLEGVIQISEMRVRDIMIPRSQMVTIDKNNDLDTLIALITNAQHSRYPIISEDKDHVEGILLAKDLLKYLGSNSPNFNIEQVIRLAVVVPESKRVDRLLKEFRKERYHMAIVVDEFGGVSGLVTIEDILEEIVGEIEDEFDNEEGVKIKKLSKRTFSVKALTTIDEFNNMFSTHFSDDEVDTIGGIVMTALGHLPSRGEVIIIDNYSFKITSANNRRVIQLQVTIPEKEPSIKLSKTTP
ncbi:CNNM family magnesium/cobalt transport protein CorC [Candidatus Photodesmus anomalopis]|uniref:Magnesium and cobalt efflux protein CorC n=1 Tax=Candidatus Photodesmus katoptron Akat1 TaxID=1236703 RepID=S3DI61_9GAMM|nr:CNNM family magnesium/cobalt transport protein CorC [Candidatus Photodesmus katoptron]EPE37385.1 magnesium and cobalt efflux protein CorC [Candidatus Photodesmus katoptron Akat1]